MLRGIYTAATGMAVQQLRGEIVANNLANLETAGYKPQELYPGCFPQVLLEFMGPGQRQAVGLGSLGCRVEEVRINLTQGSLKPTGDPWNIALTGAGFLTVETPGGIRYTRAGYLARDSQGYIVTPNGYYILGERGRIQLVSSQAPQIDEQGNVYENGQLLDRLALVTFAGPQDLLPQGDGTFRAVVPPNNVTYRDHLIKQGFLEQPPVDLARETTNLLTCNRIFETCQRAIQTQDEMAGKAINEVGVLR